MHARRLSVPIAADVTPEIVLEDLTRVAKAAKRRQRSPRLSCPCARAAAPTIPRFRTNSQPFAWIWVSRRMARKALTEAVRLAPDNPHYNLGMGMVVSFSEDPSQSLPFLNALPRPSSATIRKAFSRWAQPTSAPRTTRPLQSVSSKRRGSKATAADAHFYLGVIARQEGRLDEAIAELKQVARAPSRPGRCARGTRPDLRAQSQHG